MKLTIENIANLKNYIKNDEVVYQACGELVEVSNDVNISNRSSLLNYFCHASGIEAYPKGYTFIHEAFEDIDNWATDKDVLILLETIGIVICSLIQSIMVILSLLLTTGRTEISLSEH